jgi:hypothetical protein
MDLSDDECGPVGWKTESGFSSRIQDDEEEETVVPYQDNFSDEEEDESEPEEQYEDDGYTSTSSVEVEVPVKKIKRSRVVATPFVVVLQEENDFK